MPENTEVLDFLRVQFARQDEQHAKTRQILLDLTQRIGVLETLVATMQGSMAHLSVRLDRVDTRFDRVERRLELSDAPA